MPALFHRHSQDSDLGTYTNLYAVPVRHTPCCVSQPEFIQHLKFQKVLNRYDEFYSLDMFGESTEGHKHMNPYFPFGKGKVIMNMNFDDEDE